MKTKLALLSVFAAMLMITVSCGGPQGERAKVAEAKAVATAEGVTFTALESSVIEWIGTKPTGQHDGTISIQEGHVKVKDSQITGGEMIIDMSSIVVLDITDEAMNARLRGHLLSADFFEVETYPVAKFTFTSVEEYVGEQTGDFEFTHMVSGNLEMKEIVRNVTFPAMVFIGEDRMKASTDFFVINRADWNVKFGSRRFFDNLMDNFIHDDISLKITFEAAI
jgi:polyisoprenoid-binding protein YceI